ncbi:MULTISPECIES: hypothetical protein [Acidianus]|uniref:Uncharacterized protein n=1 Tax=Candidatus Acidianus copahuensis TaxID=1160895 RepID=A0A031LK44_9CREN|nr:MULTISPECIES: hypothetical protein [Acidianus]EZQ01911.1 hypothetical protein CM19_11835 [Candidatus Acidianus copahuensis]NON62120.1 hypothetical protein [Acidianus sp. RZ1]
MAWLSARSAEKMVYGQLTKLSTGKTLRVESFKGDRWIEVKKISEDEFLVTEKGYNNVTFSVNLPQLRQTLKKIFEDEFPRSHQLRITTTS